jgi:hypothetical protein
MTAGGPSPSETLRRMLHGYQVSQALYVAATLGIADLLAGGQKGVEELAERTGTHAPTLYRLLRLLASVGVFAEDDAGRFGLTPLAECLRSEAPGSQRAWAIMVCGPSFWSSWGELRHSVRTGETAFPKVHGMTNWEYRARHPEEGAVFDAAMTANTALESAAVADAYGFSRFGVLADVGGGQGLLLATILAANPSMRGILFDQPQVVAGARKVLGGAGVADRCEIVGGDFFDSVPGGADAYLLKSVIHDWEDRRAVEILRTCRAAMADGAKLLLVERVIRPGNAPDPAKFIDLLMLVMAGGRERTADEFGRLLDAAGFRLASVVPTAGALSIIEGDPA